MIGEVNIGDIFLYLEAYNKIVRTFAFIEIIREEESTSTSRLRSGTTRRRYFEIKPLEVYFDDTYRMEEGQPVGVKFSSHSFYTPKSINRIKNSYKKQTMRKLFGVR